MTEMNETNPSTVLPGQERYVAPLDETPPEGRRLDGRIRTGFEHVGRRMANPA